MQNVLVKSETASAISSSAFAPFILGRFGAGTVNTEYIYIAVQRNNRHTPTVKYGPIEIDSREAVSRFLNVHGKSGRQSVNF